MEREPANEAEDEKLDEMVDESFPASDPPSTTPVTGVAPAAREPEWPEGSPRKDRGEGHEGAGPGEEG